VLDPGLGKTSIGDTITEMLILNKLTSVPEMSRRNTAKRGIMKTIDSTEMDHQKISTRECQTSLRGACA
jgi:hypothetical protein